MEPHRRAEQVSAAPPLGQGSACPPAVGSFGDMRHVEYTSGSEYDPGDPFGRCVLVIDGNDASLEVRHRGVRRSWKGHVSDSTLATIDSQLTAAGYPAVPTHKVPAGSSLRTLTVSSSGEPTEDGEGPKTARMAYHEAARLPGYAEAFELLDGVIVALTAGEVPVVPTPTPGVDVTDSREQDAES
jgi:hypothetical protein